MLEIWLGYWQWHASLARSSFPYHLVEEMTAKPILDRVLSYWLASLRGVIN